MAYICDTFLVFITLNLNTLFWVYKFILLHLYILGCFYYAIKDFDDLHSGGCWPL